MWSEKGKSALNVFIIIAKKAIFPPFLFNRQILKISLKDVQMLLNGKYHAMARLQKYLVHTGTILIVVSSVYCTTIWGFKSFTS